jgi:Ca-activated chloride channel family protein
VKRSIRGTFVVLAFLAVLGLAAIGPFVARGSAWWVATWSQRLWLLALVIVPVVLYRTTLGVDGRVPRLAMPTLVPLLAGPRGVRARFRDAPGVLRAAALTFGILALARPQNVLRGEEQEERGIDIVIVLDLSGSMRAIMESDSGPHAKGALRPTRLHVAKEVITDFIAGRKTDRIGVVVFGKAAYVLAPPTLDYQVLTSLVSKMELEIIDDKGTAIGDALGVGVARLRRSNAKSKAIVLLTDGDSNSGSVSPEYATHLAQSQGVRVYTVQIGNGDDVEVEDGKDFFGQPRYVHARFPVNPELLKKIAGETGGEAFVANDKNALETSMHRILDSLEKSRFLSQAATMEDMFPWLLFAAVGLLVAEALTRVFLVRRFP